MQPFSRYLFPGLVAIFAVACLCALRSDIALVSPAPLLRAWDLVLLAALLSLLNYALRIIRWQRYLTRLGHFMPVAFVCLTYLAGFAFTVSPGKVGEIARAQYYSRFGISLPEVAGAFFIERLMDVSAMMVLATLMVAAMPEYRFAAWSGGVLAVVAIASLAIVPWGRLANALEKRQWPAPVRRLGVVATKTLVAARALLSPDLLLLGFLVGCVAWGLEGTGLYVLGSMFPGVPLPSAAGVGIYAVAVLVGALSFLPGGLGGTEAVMTALLTTQGYTVGEAFLITMACRIVTLWLAVGIGWVAVFLLRNRMLPAVSSWP